MRSELPAVRDRPQAVLEERRAFRGDPRGLKTLDLVVLQHGCVKEADHLPQDSRIAGNPYVLCHHKREPQEVIGDP